MKLKTISMLSILGILILFGCEDNNGDWSSSYIPEGWEDWELVEFDKSIHTYFPLFAEGTEFYYANDYNNAIDTERINYARYTPSETAFYNGYKNDKYLAKHSIGGTEYRIEITPNFDENNELFTKVEIIRSSALIELSYKDGVFEPADIVEILDSVIIEDEIYHNVLSIHDERFHFLSNILILEGGGMISRKYGNGITTYLIDSKIVF